MIAGSVPGKSNPASLRTRLRPPSAPTSQPARTEPSLNWTVTPSSSASNPVTSTPRRISTPSSAARAPSTDSIACCPTATTDTAGPASRKSGSAKSTPAELTMIPAKCPAGGGPLGAFPPRNAFICS